MTDKKERFRKFVLVASRWSGMARLAKPHLEGVGAILMLHSVSANPRSALGLNDHLSITPEFLDRAITDMKRSGYRFVSLDEMIEHVESGRRTRVATLTLDDAYLDNFTEALPVFEAQGTPFTVFVAPGLIDGIVQPWWEVVEQLALSKDEIVLPDALGGEIMDSRSDARKRATAAHLTALMATRVPETDRQALLDEMGSRCVETTAFMSWAQIGEIDRHALGAIGAHTVHHYSLARLDEALALAQMTESAAILEARLGRRPRHFAYPYGHAQAVGPREAKLAAQAGFVSAVTTRHGTIQPEHRGHLHSLPRMSLNGRYQDVAHLRTMLTGITALANSGRRVVTL